MLVWAVYISRRKRCCADFLLKSFRRWMPVVSLAALCPFMAPSPSVPGFHLARVPGGAAAVPLTRSSQTGIPDCSGMWRVTESGPPGAPPPRDPAKWPTALGRGRFISHPEQRRFWKGSTREMFAICSCLPTVT